MRNMKRGIKFLTLVLTMIMIVSLFPVKISAASVTTVSVGQSGCDYTEISDALDNYSSNVVINVKAGEYSKPIEISGSNVTINCEEGVILSGAGVQNDGALVYIGSESKNSPVSNVNINNLEIKDYYVAGNNKCVMGIAVEGYANNINILNCTIHNLGCVYSKAHYNPDREKTPNAHGIIVSGQEGAITNVTVSGCELYGLVLGQSEAMVFNGNVSGITCNDNYIHDCDNIGIDFIGYEGDGSEKDRAHDAECFNNRVEYCSAEKNSTYSSLCCDGIYVDGGYDIRIHDNFVNACDICIEVASEHANKTTSDVTIENNIVIAGALYGISMGGSDADENGFAVGCVIKNNTVYSPSDDVPCFNVQNASDRTNEVTKNLFICPDSEVISYGDEYNNSGNTIEDNKHIQNATISYDAVNRTITVNTCDSFSGYGAANTIVAGQSAPATVAPTATPTVAPTATPTVAPTAAPTAEPTQAPVAAVSQPYATITVDQHKSDWDGIPEADAEFVQYVRGAKVEYVKVCYDDTYNYLLFNANSFGDGYQIFIDADNDGSNGYNGYDYLIENDRLYVSTGTGWSWEQLSLSEADFTLARRDTSRHFVEVRFNRNAMGMSTSYSYAVVLLDDSFNSTYEANGSVN